MDLILGSGSPRRLELMALLGIPFRVLTCPVDESVRAGESPGDYVQRLASEKALAVQLNTGTQGENSPVIVGADTTVVLGGETLGKPQNAHAAEAMLTRLSAQTHHVMTGLAVLSPQGLRVTCRTTAVTFHPLSTDLIRAYCATEEPYDKAGGYGIQGFGARFVADLHGSYHAVVGLPLDTLGAWLNDLGFTLWQETAG